ncbi:MAG: hypothetical protein WAV22_08885 [Porticoccaceae bacterium]
MSFDNQEEDVEDRAFLRHFLAAVRALQHISSISLIHSDPLHLPIASIIMAPIRDVFDRLN